jgi:pre-mRNA 3'-end-processing factor FIP1
VTDAPWRVPGTDISDYFNYGLNERTWKEYCRRVMRFRCVCVGGGGGGGGGVGRGGGGVEGRGGLKGAWPMAAAGWCGCKPSPTPYKVWDPPLWPRNQNCTHTYGL